MITLAHGSGGQLSYELIQNIIMPAFDNPILKTQHDAANISLKSKNFAISTDSYVVQPMFFPGGDIGKLAIFGTINDLAMSGAKAKYITCGFILTEGLEIALFKKIVDSMASAAKEAGVIIVAGDTKVIEAKGVGEVYINTTGIGEYIAKPLEPSNIKHNDAIIISGDIGRHGLAVLAAREDLKFTPPIQSDCDNLCPLVEKLLNESIPINCCRDLTRGGLGANLIEIANTIKKDITINEVTLPIQKNVQAGCELLGLDPLFIANEGCMIIFVPDAYSDKVVNVLSTTQPSLGARKIGQVQSIQESNPQVVLKTPFGGSRPIYLYSGEMLPRIC